MRGNQTSQSFLFTELRYLLLTLSDTWHTVALEGALMLKAIQVN